MSHYRNDKDDRNDHRRVNPLPVKRRKSKDLIEAEKAAEDMNARNDVSNFLSRIAATHNPDYAVKVATEFLQQALRLKHGDDPSEDDTDQEPRDDYSRDFSGRKW
jgi:hypothetical protein